jgi:hypothetical protein
MGGFCVKARERAESKVVQRQRFSLVSRHDRGLLVTSCVGRVGSIRKRERGCLVGVFDDLAGKAQEFIQDNDEAIQAGIEKAGDLVDEKTDGKFAGQVDAVQGAASDYVNKVDATSPQETNG